MTAEQSRKHRVDTPARRTWLKRWVALPLVFVLASGVSWAYWSASSVPGGNGASAATSVNGGATPTASSNGTAVTVSWAASTLSNGTAVSGYSVKRYDVGTLTLQTMLSACTGTVAALTCVESSVPVGDWVYSVTPVFATNWIGAESLKSSSVTVTPPPVNDISVSIVAMDASKSGNTIYYNGVAAGSFKLTNAVSGGTGAASSATAALGGTTTGWTHTPSTVSTPAGGPYVSNTFGWAAGSTSAPTEVVTGRDTGTGATDTTLSFVNDSTAPSAGTITYADGYQPSRSVVISFTTGTDGGSGLAWRKVKRQAATLTAGTCGSYGAFGTVGGNDPTSPYTDATVASGNCYKYQYVVSDLVGNQHIATSTNVVKIDYGGAVNATAGLLSQWRLGETTTSSDSFTGTAGATLQSHTGEIGATWTPAITGLPDAVITNAGRIRKNGTSSWTRYYSSAVPASADYTVEADVYVASNLANDWIAIDGRLDPTDGGCTWYSAEYDQATQKWILSGLVNCTGGVIGQSTVQPLTVGATYRLALDMKGSTIRLLVNGVQQVAVVNTAITAAGRGGVALGSGYFDTTVTNTTGMHLDNFQVSPPAADSKGSNTGAYLNRPTLGVAGAIPGDSNTATLFDGVNDYVQAVGTTSIPVGASVRSVEMWFKTSSAARQVLFNYGTLATNQEFGLWLDAGGTTMTAWGKASDKTFTMPYAVNNGAWHQVVKTYDGTNITVYIDGVGLTPQASTRATVMDANGFGIGAVIVPGDGSASGGYFNGQIDEVSLYTTTLSLATIVNHYQFGDVTGPAGGSVDASGLVGTGSRYSTSTTLSVSFNGGSDPSGLAPTGAYLQRATAPLTSAGTANGACGSYGSYVMAGNDPVSPLSAIVADQACYRYRYSVPDALYNYATFQSPDIKVDTTAPAAPSLSFSSFTNTYWSGTGSTVFYRSAVTPGSFIATGSTTDTGSGIVSYAFPALGANWTSTPGALGVNTYSWSGAPAAPGTKSLTATNNATVTSTGTPFTLTADDTAPTAGTVSYPDGTTTSTSVSVSFTTGTDGGSGVGTRLLQRASAPLTSGVCGSYGSFATVTGGTNPTSPVADSVTIGNCYMYQYVVSDNVGNQHIATSASVAQVTTYFDMISGTGGLLSQWRLGESTVSSDTFTGTSATNLTSHTGEIGATWTYKTGSSSTFERISSGNRLRGGGSTSGYGYSINYTNGTPLSPDYSVEADLYVASNVSGDMAGVIGRMNTTNNTFYMARYEQTSTRWNLLRYNNGTPTSLGYSTQALTVGQSYRVRLSMVGSAMRLYVNGVLTLGPFTDSTWTAAGNAGIMDGQSGSTATKSNSAGLHFDNFQVTPRAADSWGTNIGDYLNGPTLGVAGAITGDSDTAATFDGTNDYASVTRQISDDFSIEFWFKSTQGIGTGTQWWNGAGLVDAEVSGAVSDFGVSLRSDGKVVGGVGGGSDTSIVSTSGGYDNGAWHHVVFTRTKSSGALKLYVDGVAAGTATGSTVSLTSSPNINFGRIQAGNNYFLGSLDEVAVYSSVLSGPAVTTHYNAAQ